MFTNADELRHDTPVEAWWWWGYTPLATAGWFVGLEVRGTRFDYWAGLVRAGQPYLYVEELDGEGLRQGLEIKPPEMWAGHDCDLPYQQWSLGNEAHGVLLDDPEEALDRAFGELAPVTFDIEWYADGEAQPLSLTPGASGYAQNGNFDARIELATGELALEGAANRLHVWGVPHRPSADPLPDGDPDDFDLWAPYRRSDGTGVLQVLTRAGWSARSVRRP
jgi:hypothetical protein